MAEREKVVYLDLRNTNLRSPPLLNKGQWPKLKVIINIYCNTIYIPYQIYDVKVMVKLSFHSLVYAYIKCEHMQGR